MWKNKIPVIGIPRALFYFKKPYFWENLFRGLGFEVFLSPESNREIVNRGVEVSDPETCFSLKVFFGHLDFLERKEEVDILFIPRYIANEERLEYCPKLFGIPDVAEATFNKVILTLILDERKKNTKETLEDFCRMLAQKFGIKADTRGAIREALKKEKEREKEAEEDFERKMQSEKKKIALISHPYNLYDNYVNVGVDRKIKDLGGEPIFIDEAPRTAVKDSVPQFHWEFGREIMEHIETLKNYEVSGAIQISAFQCGCDAVLKEFVEKEIKEQGIPFFYLIVDEHTGDAGVQTRVEAFWDTL